MNSVNLNQIIFSVDEYLEFADTLLSQARVVVAGEITRVDKRDKYTFFSLTGEGSQGVLPCFMWGYVMDKIGVELRVGMKIRILGHGAIFAKRGSFNFEVEHIELQGEGVVNEAFEVMKRKLESEGIFAQETKRVIPQYVDKIGLITSRHGQAIHDFLTHLGNQGVSVYHKHVMVEGVYAVESIVEAIKEFNAYYAGEVEVLVLTRGGGSMESLQAYNSEVVARAIKASRIPVLSAIGHHQDVSIADLAADYSCSTPTHAGEYLARSWKAGREQVIDWKRNWRKGMETNLIRQRELLGLQEQKVKNLPQLMGNKIIQQANRVQDNMNGVLIKMSWQIEVGKKSWRQCQTRMDLALQQRGKLLKAEREKVKRNFRQNLHGLDNLINYTARSLEKDSPQARLGQGYAIVKDKLGKTITRSGKLSHGQEVQLMFADGERGMKSLD